MGGGGGGGGGGRDALCGVWERVLVVALPAATPPGRLEAGRVVQTFPERAELPGCTVEARPQHCSWEPRRPPQALHSRNANS